MSISGYFECAYKAAAPIAWALTSASFALIAEGTPSDKPGARAYKAAFILFSVAGGLYSLRLTYRFITDIRAQASQRATDELARDLFAAAQAIQARLPQSVIDRQREEDLRQAATATHM